MKNEYCQCCKHSYDTGRRHLYTKEHIKKLSEWYDRQIKRFNEVYEIVETLSTLVTDAEHSFWCAFCHKEIKDKGHFIVKNACDHLISEEHKSKVYYFMKKNGTNHNKYQASSFIMSEELYEKYMDACDKILNNESMINISTKIGPQKPTSTELYAHQLDQWIQKEEELREEIRVKNQKLFATYPYQNIKAIYPLYNEQTLMSMPYQCNAFVTDSLLLETNKNQYGVEQNPSGYNENGERVWGGGVVDIPKKKWILWPIDLLYLYSEQQKNEFLQRKRKEKEEKDKQERILSRDILTKRIQNPHNNDKFLDIYAPGLSIITFDSDETLPYGNVYNNSGSDTLPWLVSKNTELLQKRSENVLSDPIDPRYPKKLRAIDLGIVRTKDRSLSTVSKSWLPNFGSAWQTGSRYNYKTEFEKEYRESKAEEQKNQKST